MRRTVSLSLHLDSALGRHPDPSRDLKFPKDRQWIACDTNHMSLLDRPEAYSWIRSRLKE